MTCRRQVTKGRVTGTSPNEREQSQQQQVARAADRTLTLVSECVRIDPRRLRTLLFALVERMEQVGLPPVEVGVSGGGIRGQRYKSWRRMKEKVLASDFGTIRSISIRNLWQPYPRELDYLMWRSEASFGHLNNPRRPWHFKWTIVLSDQMPEERALTTLMEFAKMSVDRYGYIFPFVRDMGPGYYALGLQYGRMKPGCDEEGDDIINWDAHLACQRPVLRDLYRYNLLQRRHLEVKVGNSTLRKWIESSRERGALRSLGNALWVWEIPPDGAPYLREQLFPTGLLFHSPVHLPERDDTSWPIKARRAVTPRIFERHYRRVIDVV